MIVINDVLHVTNPSILCVFIFSLTKCEMLLSMSGKYMAADIDVHHNPSRLILTLTLHGNQVWGVTSSRALSSVRLLTWL